MVKLRLCLHTYDWNDLPDSLVSSAELSDNCVSKFTSLVRSRPSPGEVLSFLAFHQLTILNMVTLASI